MTRFRWLLLGCCLVGLVVRLGLGWHTSTEHLGSDTPFFRDGASELVSSGRLTVQRQSSVLTTAKHPPGFVLVLAAGDAVGVDTVTEQRVLLALIGTIGVAFVGLAGLRLGGATAGTVAAAIAAVHPMWVQPGVIIMSEALLTTVVSGAVLMSLVHVEKRTPLTAALAAATIAAAAMVRSEALVALVLMAPVLVIFKGIGWRTTLRLALGFGVGAALVLGPWLVRNTIVAGTPVMSTNAGVTLAGANCDETYGGPNQGGFNSRCALGTVAVTAHFSTSAPGPRREAHIDAQARSSAFRYARDHPREAMETAAVRVMRAWTPAKLDAQVQLDKREGRLPRWQTAGRWFHVLLLIPAGIGTVALFRRNRRQAAVLVVFVAQVTIAVAVVYGSARIRTSAEPSIALLAGVGVVAVVDRLARRFRSDREPSAESPLPV